MLPKGLLYTTILSPVFFYNTLRQRQKTWWLQFGIFLLVFDAIHLWQGVNLPAFIVSNILFILIYFSVIAFYNFFSRYQHLGRIFRQLVLFNALLVLIALPFFFAPKPYMEAFWYINKLTQGFADFPRLALFTYEASYYSLLMVPVFYYYVLKFLFNDIEHNRWLTLMLVTVPLLLSFSFGVLGITVVTALIMMLVFRRRLLRYRRPFLLALSIVLVLLLVLAVLFIWYPHNALFVRIDNILAKKDTSANGRIFDSYTIGWRIASLHNIFFGCGLGQVKFMIIEMVHKYYRYWGAFSRYDIPNTMGETLAIFGLVGVALRIGLEIWLFFKTRVYSNYYRLALFIFVFIYQFTGSFITNIAEYTIWALAFAPVFSRFDIPWRIKKHV